MFDSNERQYQAYLEYIKSVKDNKPPSYIRSALQDLKAIDFHRLYYAEALLFSGSCKSIWDYELLKDVFFLYETYKQNLKIESLLKNKLARLSKTQEIILKELRENPPFRLLSEILKVDPFFLMYDLDFTLEEIIELSKEEPLPFIKPVLIKYYTQGSKELLLPKNRILAETNYKLSIEQVESLIRKSSLKNNIFHLMIKRNLDILFEEALYRLSHEQKVLLISQKNSLNETPLSLALSLLDLKWAKLLILNGGNFVNLLKIPAVLTEDSLILSASLRLAFLLATEFPAYEFMTLTYFDNILSEEKISNHYKTIAMTMSAIITHSDEKWILAKKMNPDTFCNVCNWIAQEGGVKSVHPPDYSPEFVEDKSTEQTLTFYQPQSP